MVINREKSSIFKSVSNYIFSNKVVATVAIGTIGLGTVFAISNINSKAIQSNNNDNTTMEDPNSLNNPTSYNSIITGVGSLENILNMFSKASSSTVVLENDATTTEATTAEATTTEAKEVIQTKLEKTSVNQTSKLETPTIVSDNNNSIITTKKDTPTNPAITNTRKVIAISYENVPSEYTEEIIKILKDNNAEATFFVLGVLAEQNPGLLRAIDNSGNKIGNGSYMMVNLEEYTGDQIKEFTQKTNEAIYDATGKYPTLYRSPWGTITDDVKENVNLPVVQWTTDPRDYIKNTTVEEGVKLILSGLSDGGIISFFDSGKRGVEISKIVIPEIKKLGYDIVTVEELFNEKNIPLEKGKVYRKAAR